MEDENRRKILAALDYASVKHQYQRRSGYEPLPYVNHLIKVAALIEEVGLGSDIDLMLIAILHDVIEDTDATHKEIADKFGSTVADVVLELTDDMDLPHHERKRLQVHNASGLSRNARIIRLADKISNIRDMLHYPINWPLEKKLNYLDNSLDVLEQIRGTFEPLEKMLEMEVTLGKQKLKN